MKKLLVIVVLGLIMYINNLHAKEMPIIECSIIHDGNVVKTKVFDLNRSIVSTEGDSKDQGCCDVMNISDDEILWRSLTYGIFPFTHTHQASGASGVIYRVNNSANRKTGHYYAKVFESDPTEAAALFFGECKAASLDKKF